MKCVWHGFLRDGFFSSPNERIITLSHTFLCTLGAVSLFLYKWS